MNYANYSSSSKFTLEIIAPDQVPDPNYRGLGLNNGYVGSDKGFQISRNIFTGPEGARTLPDGTIVPNFEYSVSGEKYAKQLTKGIAAMALHTGISIASKAAGYAGNYIQQTRINETVAFATRFGALGASFMTGNPAIIALATIGTGVSIGMSVWDYHEKIKIENLSASYQASYRGARMNAGKV